MEKYMWEPTNHNTVTTEQKHREESVQGFFIMIAVVALIGFLVFTGFKPVSQSKTVAIEKNDIRKIESHEESAAEKAVRKKKESIAKHELPEAYKNELETSYGSLEISLMEIEQSRVQSPHKTTAKEDLGYTLSGENKSAIVDSLTPFDKLPSIKDIAPELDKEMQSILKERKLAAEKEKSKAAEEERKIQESYQKYLNERSK